MADSGMFSFSEFLGRNVLRLAPDGFMAINTQIGLRFVSPLSSTSDNNGYQSLDVRGGVTSINITAAVSPPGANRANIQIVAPIYKGLHEDYYFTQPNGVRKCIIEPMMEIKVYLKGYYLKNGNPIYYPAFWGYIKDVSEDYSGGVYNISITCNDLLSLWKYQQLTIVPSSLTGAIGPAPDLDGFPTIFRNKNIWQIMYSLFYQTKWVDSDKDRYDFVYPLPSEGIKVLPSFGSLFKGSGLEDFFSDFANDYNAYWRNRLGATAQKSTDRMTLEMFGLLESVDLTNQSINEYLLSYDDLNKSNSQEFNVKELRVNFSLLAQIQPYGQFNIFNGGKSALEHNKLEIATEVCEQSEMEFFMDTNGSCVFKPPFYNLDVNTASTPEYTIKAKDIINFNSSVDTDQICTWLQVVGPKYPFDPKLDSIAYHFDFDLIKRFGIRRQKLDLRYGNNAEQLRLLAAAKMAKMNGRAYTGSVSIPMRPEVRLGYPVYLSHIDSYYYVTGLSHSIAFGSSSTTSLSLEVRRDRIFSDGTIDGFELGDVLDGCVFRYNNAARSINSDTESSTSALETVAQINNRTREAAMAEALKTFKPNPGEEDVAENEKKKYLQLLQNGLMSGPNLTGFYKVDKARVESSILESGKKTVVSNELIMMSFPDDTEVAAALDDDEQIVSNIRSKETIPYTDIKGYRHIGGYPYGANLKITPKGFVESSPGADSASEARELNGMSPASSSGYTPTGGTEGGFLEAMSAEPQAFQQEVDQRQEVNDQNEDTRRSPQRPQYIPPAHSTSNDDINNTANNLSSMAP